MEAVKLREQYEQALLLLSNLQQLPPIHERSLSKLFLLIRLSHSIQNTAKSLPDKNSSSNWQQRAVTLHGNLTVATAQFLQSADQSGEQFWDGCLRLLYMAAEACDQLEKEKNSVMAQLVAEKERCARLEHSLVSEHQKIEMGIKEVVELRSKIANQQQIIEPLEKNYREAYTRLDITIKEKHALAAEKENLIEERTRNMQTLDRQTKTIDQLTERCENSAKEKVAVLGSLSTVNEDNHTLRVNLGQHGQVIESLITINAEMMDAANYYSLQLEEKKRADAQRQAETHLSSIPGEDLQKSPNPEEIILDGHGHHILKPEFPWLDEKAVLRVEVQTGSTLMENKELVQEMEDEKRLSQMDDKKGVSLRDKEPQPNPFASTSVGPSEDAFARIKARNLSADALDTLANADRLKYSDAVFENGEETSSRFEQPRKISWTSDMLLPEKRSASLEDLQSMEGRTLPSQGSLSFGDMNDFEKRSPTASSTAQGLLGNWGGVGGRLQRVGGKAKGFLHFVAGADLAPAESP